MKNNKDSTDNNINIMGKRLKELRKKTGLTQRSLSRDLGIPRETYAQYETGRRKPDYLLIKKIAQYHGVSIDYLVGNNTELSDPGIAIMMRARKSLSDKAYDEFVNWAETFYKGLEYKEENENKKK